MNAPEKFRLPRGSALAASGAVGLVLLLFFLAVWHGNIEIFRFINRDGGPVLDLVMDWTTQLCGGYANFFLFLFLLAWSPRLGLRGLKALFLVLLFVKIAKILFNEPRPLAVLEGVRVLGRSLKHGSFPSGHTTEMMAVAVVLHAVLGIRAIPLYFLALMGGISRIYVGAHFPVDVVAGLYLGSAAGWLSGLRSGWDTEVSDFLEVHSQPAALGISVTAAATALAMRFGTREAGYSPGFYSTLCVLVLIAAGRLLWFNLRRPIATGNTPSGL